MRHRAAFIVTLTTSLSLSAASLGAELWYQDPVHGRRNAAEFIEKFNRPDTFKQATRYIDVYLIPMNVFLKGNRFLASDDKFLSAVLFPYLAKNNIKLALNPGGARWMQVHLRGGRFKRDVELLTRLKRLGGRVDYISLQSLLSKRKNVDDYPLDERIADAVVYAKAVRDIYPDLKVGLIDALPSQGRDYRQPYRQLSDALARGQVGLSYIHLDMPLEIITTGRRGVSWDTVREVERYVEDQLGINFGLYTTSRKGGQTSNVEFHRRVMRALECYMGFAGGTPKQLIIASWFPYPDKIIPEYAVGDEYPMMRTVLQYGRTLEEIEKAGPAWASHRASRSDWDAKCTRE